MGEVDFHFYGPLEKNRLRNIQPYIDDASGAAWPQKIMTKYELLGDPPVSVTMRRSAQARKLSLRISSLDDRVTLTIPKFTSEKVALGFAQEKADWIRGHLAKRPGHVDIRIGTSVPVEGHMRKILAISGRKVVLSEDEIYVAANSCGKRVERFLRELARERLVEACDTYARRLGREYQRITLRDTRSRWGSCSSAGGLMFSWRLIMAPPSVLHYVAAHEVAHLAQMNHSQAFWDTVTHLYGAYEADRGWLRCEGNALHRYRFE